MLRMLSIAVVAIINVYTTYQALHIPSLTGAEALCCSSYGGGNIPILVYNVACSGSENALVYCPLGSYNRRCDHDDDAAVVCNPSEVIIILCSLALTSPSLMIV